MYKVQNFVGIDISRNFFDAALLVINEPTKVTHCRFDQNHQGYLAMQDWLMKNGVLINEQTLFCMEFTGIYNNGLLDFLGNQNSLVWVEMALRIKRSQGFSRSDTDRTDAIKIAQYAYRYQENMKLWRPVDAHLKKLKHLMTQRDRIVRSITALSVPVNELKATGDISIAQQMEKLQSSAIKQLIAAQQKIETTIDKLVMQDQELAAKVNRVVSVKGIGKVTAVALLVYTNGFTSFQSGKELSCYCGVVPFVRKESGVSVRSRSRISPFANKKLKCLMHLCALSAMQSDTEIKAYYERKILEGKNKMSIINAIRNKLLLRVFAVLRDNRDFVDNYSRQCA